MHVPEPHVHFPPHASARCLGTEAEAQGLSSRLRPRAEA